MKERDVQKAILGWLQARHILAFRMQSGATTATYKGKSRLFRYGTPGMSDVLAFPLFRDALGLAYTVPYWLECKSSTGKQSQLQKSFQKQVTEQGHQYLICRSVDDVIAALGGNS